MTGLRWWRRLPAWLRIAALFTAISIVLGVAGAQATMTKLVVGDQPAGQVMISADQRTLVIEATRCGNGTLTVLETASTVTVRLHLGPDLELGDCPWQTFTATLTAPIGSRRLVDAVTHAELPSVDGGAILRPTYLPPGFIHGYDAALFPRQTVGPASARYLQLYAQNRSYEEALWITQYPGGVWQPPDGVTSTPIVVRGHPGTAVPGEIDWTERGQLFTIRSMTYAYAVLSQQELVAIGDSLR